MTTAANLVGGPRVLNTRAAHQSVGLSTLLRAAGFEPIEAPAIRVVPGWSNSRIAEVAAGLRAGHYGWAVLPSPNVVDCLVQALAPYGGAALLHSARLLGGTGTAQRLIRHGLEPALTLARFSAEAALAALRELAPGPVEGSIVLLPRAVDGRDALAIGLRSRGTAIEEVMLYRTEPAAPATLLPVAGMLARDALAAVTLTSPSSVRGLVDGLRAVGCQPTELLPRVPLVCIGGTTAGAVRSSGLPVAAVADETSLASLVEAVRSVVDTRGPSGSAPHRRGAGARPGAPLAGVNR